MLSFWFSLFVAIVTWMFSRCSHRCYCVFEGRAHTHRFDKLVEIQFRCVRSKQPRVTDQLLPFLEPDAVCDVRANLPLACLSQTADAVAEPDRGRSLNGGQLAIETLFDIVSWVATVINICTALLEGCSLPDSTSSLVQAAHFHNSLAVLRHGLCHPGRTVPVQPAPGIWPSRNKNRLPDACICVVTS